MYKFLKSVVKFIKSILVRKIISVDCELKFNTTSEIKSWEEPTQKMKDIGIESNEGADLPSTELEFKFKNEVLDKLDLYFKFIQRLKKDDPTAYNLYSKFGANLIPDSLELCDSGELNPWWKEGNRPSFGAITLGIDLADGNGYIHPKFQYFQKIDSAPPWVEQSKDIYCCTLFYLNEAKVKDGGKFFRFYVSLTNGNIRLLREKRRKWERGDIPSTQWRYNRQFDTFAKDKTSSHYGRDAKEIARRFFSILANTYVESKGMIQILAKKNDITSCFSIQPKRNASFFKDRTHVKVDGKTKRIFHIVRPHIRSNESVVRMHFRGLRDFVWNGYSIHISVPTIHHNDILDLDAAGIIQDFDEGGLIVSANKMGEIIQKELSK